MCHFSNIQNCMKGGGKKKRNKTKSNQQTTEKDAMVFIWTTFKFNYLDWNYLLVSFAYSIQIIFFSDFVEKPKDTKI